MDLTFELEELRKKSTEQSWFVDYKELEISKKPFASGTTSDIFDCNWRGLKIVIKRLKIKDNFTLKGFLNEIKIWHTIRHPNIVQFLGISIFAEEIYILLQKINGSNLKKYLFDNKITNSLKKSFTKQLVSIFNFLHNCKPQIIYRDLKAENILVEDDKIYLTDFGISRFYPESSNFKMTGKAGTWRYMAPEVFHKQVYNLKADVYSLGMILYFIYKNELPFSGFNKKRLIEYFDNENDFYVDLKNENVKKIIINCTTKNIEKRYNIQQLVEDVEAIKDKKYFCCFNKLFN